MNKKFSDNDITKNKNNQDKLTDMGSNHSNRTEKDIFPVKDKQGFTHNPYGQKGYPGPQTDSTAPDKSNEANNSYVNENNNKK